MQGTRTLISWGMALILVVMLLWMAAETLAPQPPTRNHLFEVLRDASDIAYFEPTGRFAFGVLGVLSALLILAPPTRRAGAILATLLLGVLVALVGQLMLLGISVPVDQVADGGTVSTVETDPSALFYLVAGLLAISLALIFVHPGAEENAGANYAI